MTSKYICDLCNYNTLNNYSFIRHCTTNKHKIKETNTLKCMTCNKTYNSIRTFNKHKKYIHNIDNYIQTDKDTNNKIITTIIESGDKINKNIKEVKTEVNEVKITVNKALNKASSLIKYLMQYYPSVPPMKKITYKKCIDTLRIDYDCKYSEDNKYKLELELIKQYKKGILVDTLYKSILNLVNYKKPNMQQIYNTDSSRYNYIIKTEQKWNEDIAGIKFTDYIINPLLEYIGELLKVYREELENINIRSYSTEETHKYLTKLEDVLNLETAISKDTLIKPILKKLAPYLRYLEEEIEKMEHYSEIEKLQRELEEIVNE